MKFNLRAIWQNKKKKKKKPKPGGGYGFVSKLLCRVGAHQFVVELEQKFSPGINHKDELTGVYIKERLSLACKFCSNRLTLLEDMSDQMADEVYRCIKTTVKRQKSNVKERTWTGFLR